MAVTPNNLLGSDLPPLPPPQQAAPGIMMNGPVDVVVPKGPNGQAAGPVYVRPSGQQGGIPSMPAPSGFSPATMPGSADIPPPHMAAPWMYNRQALIRPSMPPGYPGSNFQNNQNNFYNNPAQQQAVAPAFPTQGSRLTQPQQPQQQPQPTPPVASPPPAPAPAPTPPPAPPAQPAPKPEPPKPAIVNGFDQDKIKILNDQLSNANESVRSDAAMDLFKILEANPGLDKNPTYGEYVNAFLEKILKDPSPVVRQGAELALELGYVDTPSQAVKDLLGKIAQSGSLYNIEGDSAKNILSSLAKPKPAPTPAQQTPQQSAQPQPDAKQAPVGGQLNQVSPSTEAAPATPPQPPKLDVTSPAPAAPGNQQQPQQPQQAAAGVNA